MKNKITAKKKPSSRRPRTKLYFYTSNGCAPCRALKKAGTPEKLAASLGLELVTVNTDDADADYTRILEDGRFFSVPTLEVWPSKAPAVFVGGASLAKLTRFFQEKLAREK